MNNPPAEVLKISPESLEVANAYLECQDMQTVSDLLGIPKEDVADVLSRPDVKAYISQVFYDIGFNNRFKMRSMMDGLIARKLKDLDEADMGSSKDITELLALSHKMTMDVLDREIQLEKLKVGNVKSQVNVQINNNARYNSLIEKLIGEKLA